MHQEAASTHATHFNQGVDTAPPPADPESSLADPGESLVAAQTDMDHSLASHVMPPLEDAAPPPSASPPPLAPRIPEERDSLPLTPPCRELAGEERGRSEESRGWNVVRNTPPDNIASGKPCIRDLT